MGEERCCARSLRVSLAEAYPQVAATWLQERNGGLTPEKVTLKMQVDVWWRCPAGHGWKERIANRTSPKWKNGDVVVPAARASATSVPWPVGGYG